MTIWLTFATYIWMETQPRDQDMEAERMERVGAKETGGCIG